MPRVDIPNPIEDAVWCALRGIPRPLRDAIAIQILGGRKGQGKKDRDLDDGGVPVKPNAPRGLSGGAAAALEFDD